MALLHWQSTAVVNLVVFETKIVFPVTFRDFMGMSFYLYFKLAEAAIKKA
jgi:hypothetical protein